MGTTNRWFGVGLLLLASVGFACGRTDLPLAGLTDASENSTRRPIADAAVAPDLASLSSPDVASPRAPDVAPPFIADVALPRSPDVAVARVPDVAPPFVPDLALPRGPDVPPDLRNPNCGNTFVDPGEECDDGNTQFGDGCDQNCHVECDWLHCWPRYPWSMTYCGDGVLGPGEECDDGNTRLGDGCSGVCKIEPDFGCAMPGRPCSPICGDGVIVGMETCDDGNSVGGDGCSEFCLTEDCWDCRSGVCQPRPPVVDGGSCRGLPVAWCGDGKLEGAEECDDGPANSDSAYGGCSTHCHYLTCGDGIVSKPEQCDLGFAKNTSSVYGDRTGCTSACTVPRYCGDGYLDNDYGEECDLGAVGNKSSSCTPTCHILLP